MAINNLAIALLTPITDLRPTQEDKMPVTCVNNPNGEGKVVLSRFGDIRWNISPLFGSSNYTPSEMTLNFSLFPESQQRFWKRYIYALMLRAQENSSRNGSDRGIAGTTLVGKFDVLSDFVRYWLAKEDLNSILALIDPEHSKRMSAKLLDSYISYANCASSIGVARSRLSLLDDLYQLAACGYLKDGFDYPVITPGKPDEFIITKLKSKEKANKGKPATHIIADKLTTLMAKAIREKLNNAKNVCLAWQEVRPLVSVNPRYFSTHGNNCPTGRSRQIRHLHPYGFNSPQEVSRAAYHLYDACLVAVGFYTGFRANEITDIEIDGIEKVIDAKGYFHYYITTVIRKTCRSKRGELHRRPVAKAAYEAIEAVIELTKPVRLKMLEYIERLKFHLAELKVGSEEFCLVLGDLNDAQKQKNKVFLSLNGRTQHIGSGLGPNGRRSTGAKYGVLTFHDRRFNAFVKENDIRDPSINNGIYLKLSFHPMRRTLARYIARFVRNDPYIVKWLYGHKGAFMSELYMQPDPDNEFFDMIEEEIFIQNADLLEGQIVSTKPLAGQVGKQLMKMREQLAFRSSREIAEGMAKGALLVFNGHSWCFAENGQDLCDFSQCVIQPIRCLDCPRTFINDVLLPIWQAIHDNTEKVIEFIDDPFVKRQQLEVVNKSHETINLLRGRVANELRAV